MADRFDLDAIDADDALLDLLAAGGESARTAGEHDPAVKLLADLRLAVEVEDELPVETIDDPESFLARCAALNPVTDPFARKVAARGLALGVAAVAALSVSGVAAAVTGDPLSPYEKVIEKMVDAVRPETSFPKEQLDGMPVVDKTKIVKVAKDFKKKADERKAEEQQKAKTNPFVLDPPADRQQAMPPLLRPAPVEKPTVTQESIAPEPTQPTKAPEKTDDKPVDETTTEPTAPPTDDPTTEPSTDPTTPPPTEPTTDPTTPPPTEPTTDPTTPPPNNGETGETGTNPTTTPTVPGNDSGSHQGSNSGESGDDSPAEDQLPIEIKPPVDDTPPPAEDQKTPPADEKPAESPLGGLTGLVEKILPQVLPTPSGEAAEVPSAETAFGTEGKHSSGKVTTGSVKQTYAQGKHSTGLYAEGKHAAIARAHGSTESPDVLTILGVVNKPTS
ncbi:hypothetical protein ACGFIF_17350 [Kribbella sp. NPDC049174]|uniref:hypothetical protein n=1 Tax=Kribbella sp. NPDC049174 TaxID=3364112 RepID=UPI003715B403